MNVCTKHIKGKRLRLTSLDSVGRTLQTSQASLVISAFVQLQFTSVYEPGAETNQFTADGDLCLAYKDKDKLKRVDWDLQICNADPYAHKMVAGGATIAVAGGGVGYKAPAVGEDALPNGFSIEVWARNVDSSGAPDPDYLYAWYVLPREYGTLGSRAFQNGPLDISFSGYGIENNAWYDGPQNNHPSPADTGRVWSWVPTNAIPDATCGYVAGLTS